MFLIVDILSNNVLAECGSYAAAEQRRVQLIGANPDFAEYIEVVDMQRELIAYDRAEKTAAAPHETPQPA